MGADARQPAVPARARLVRWHLAPARRIVRGADRRGRGRRAGGRAARARARRARGHRRRCAARARPPARGRGGGARRARVARARPAAHRWPAPVGRPGPSPARRSRPHAARRGPARGPVAGSPGRRRGGDRRPPPRRRDPRRGLPRHAAGALRPRRGALGRRIRGRAGAGAGARGHGLRGGGQANSAPARGRGVRAAALRRALVGGQPCRGDRRRQERAYADHPGPGIAREHRGGRIAARPRLAGPRLRPDRAALVPRERGAAARGGHRRHAPVRPGGDRAGGGARRRRSHARAAIAELDRTPRAGGHAVDEELGLARAWTAAASGELVRAQQLAAGVAGGAEARGARGSAVRALHELCRLGEPEVAAPRLAALAAVVDGPFAALAATHATALAARDGHALLDVAERFAATGARLLAAEAAGAAEAALRAGGLDAAARAAARRAAALLEDCEGAVPGCPAAGQPQSTAAKRARSFAPRAGFSDSTQAIRPSRCAGSRSAGPSRAARWRVAFSGRSRRADVGALVDHDPGDGLAPAAAHHAGLAALTRKPSSAAIARSGLRACAGGGRPRARGRRRSGCRSRRRAAASPLSRRSSRNAARLASAGEVGAPCGRCGVASRRASRKWPATDSRSGTTFVHRPVSVCATPRDSRRCGRCRRRARRSPRRRSPRGRAGRRPGGRVRRARGCAPSGRDEAVGGVVDRDPGQQLAQDPALDLLQARFGRSITRGGPLARAAGRSGSCAAARRRPALEPATSASQASWPWSSSRPLGEVADRVDPRHRPRRTPHPGVKQRPAQDARRRGRSVSARRGRSGGGGRSVHVGGRRGVRIRLRRLELLGGRQRRRARPVERRAVVGVEHRVAISSTHSGASSNTRRPRAASPFPSTAPRGRRRRARGRARGAWNACTSGRATTLPDGSCRACAPPARSSRRAHAMRCGGERGTPQGDPGDAPAVRARARIVAMRTLTQTGYLGARALNTDDRSLTRRSRDVIGASPKRCSIVAMIEVVSCEVWSTT